jgi:sugar phosphate isomerase/epimerase
MKLAASNIGWAPEEDRGVAELLLNSGFEGVEIAPTRVWDAPQDVTESEARGHRRFWNERGLEVVALQALLFGRPELTLFESPESRSRTLEHLSGLMRLGEWLGARVLVFGAPRNRRVAGRANATEARHIAVDFFAAAGGRAGEHGVVLAIEPNPVQYECDFITSSKEGLDLVRAVGRAGFGLHLDAAAMTLAGEPLADSVVACAGMIEHFHASEPSLAPVGEGTVDHPVLGGALRQIGYAHWVSIEMRAHSMSSLSNAIRYVANTYGG